MRWILPYSNDSPRPKTSARSLKISYPILIDEKTISAYKLDSSNGFEDQSLSPQSNRGSTSSHPKEPKPAARRFANSHDQLLLQPLPLRIRKSRQLKADFAKGTNKLEASLKADEHSPDRLLIHNLWRESISKGPYSRQDTNSFCDIPKAETRYSSSNYTAHRPSTCLQRESDNDISIHQESVNKQTPILCCAMAVFGILLLVAISLGAIGTSGFVKVHTLSNVAVEATKSEVYDTSLKLVPTLSTTAGDDDGTVMSITTAVLGLSSGQTPTLTPGSTKTSRSSLTARSSLLPTTTDNSLVQRRMLDAREETVVIGQEPECDHTDMTTTTMSITLHPNNQTSQTSFIAPAVQSNIARRRFHAPFAWANFKRTQVLGTTHVPAVSSFLMPTQTTMKIDVVEQIVSIASTNAAAPKFSVPWIPPQPSRVSTATASIDRRQSAGRQYTFWEAYSNIRSLAVQLCSTTQWYQSIPSIKSADDDRTMSWANTYICDSMATNFTSVPQGDRCGTKIEWQALGKAVESLCNQQRVGTVLVQSVNLICHAKSNLEGNVEECAEGNSSLSSTVGRSTTIKTSRSTVAVSSSFPAQSSAAALSSESLPNSSPSLSTFQSSVPTTVSTISSIISLPPHSRITATPKGSSVNHLATYTGWLANTNIGRPPPTPLAGDSSVSMITFSTPAPYVLVTTDVPTTTPYANTASPKHNGLSRSWEIYEPWPIPLGYYGSTLVPAAHQTGQISHYDPATNLAYPACEPQGGHYLQPNELGVAISWQLLDWQRGNLCNRKILAWWDGGENLKGETSSQAVFRVRDGCTACRPSDLDIFEHVWDGIVAPNGLGRAHVTWRWMRDDEVASATAGG